MVLQRERDETRENGERKEDFIASTGQMAKRGKHPLGGTKGKKIALLFDFDKGWS